MKNEEYIYRPKTLHMALNGQSVEKPDILMIENSLTKQNICIACYKEAKTTKELTEILGIPMAYIESDLKWLVEKEFINKSKEKYSTSFMIQTAEEEQEKFEIYLKHKKDLSDIIVNELIAAEEKIRSIGFYGSDKPMERLLWLLIYRFCDYQKIPYYVERPIRPDGGKYFPLGFDRTEQEGIKKIIKDWDYNGSMSNIDFYWFGLYNFGQSEIEDMMDAYRPEWKKLNSLLCEIICSNGDISSYDENKKYDLAILAEKGFVKIEGTHAFPNFCVFTDKQYEKLEETVFEPLAKKLEEEIKLIAKEFIQYCKDKIPSQLKSYHDLFVKMALMDIGFVTTAFAFDDGKLYKPTDKRDGEFLTLMYINYKK